MTDGRQIVFSLKTTVDGEEISPRTINLALFNHFNREVEAFLIGSGHQVPADRIQVSVEGGSYRLVVLLPLAAAMLVEPDVRRLELQDGLRDMDQRRAAIVQQWQQRARKMPDYRVEVSTPEATFRPVVISRETDFHTPDQDEWAAVDKYLRGKVVDMGGTTRANVHLVLEGSGTTLIAESTPDYLHDQRENYLYRTVQVRIAAEENTRTGRLRKERLLAFVGQEPSYDESELNALVDAGTRAWADVPDAVAWVREQRGGKSE
jgi:hypothetical protein